MTNLRRRTSRLGAALVAVALLLASCGGDNEPSDALEDQRSEAERDADEALAEAAVLTIADIPTGWEEEMPDEDDSSDTGFDEEFAECLGVDPTIFDTDNPKAESPSFVSPNELRVQSEVSVTPSDEWATERLELFGHERMPSCLESTLQDGFDNPDPEDVTPGVEYGDVEVARSSFPNLGDGALAYRFTIPAATNEMEVEIFIDMVLVRVGRVGITMTFQGLIEPFPPEGAEELTQVVVDRLSVEI